MACLFVLVLGVGQVGAVPSGNPPVLPEVTAADAAFRQVASGAVPSSAPVSPSSANVLPAAHAYGHHAVGYLAIETPVGQTPDRPQDNTPAVLGRLEFPRLVGSFGLFAAGKLQTKAGLPYSKENSACVGIEAAVFHDWTAYTYAERRFDVGANRIMAGVRYNFNVGF